MKLGRKPTYDYDALMSAALRVAARKGYNVMSRADIADEAGCSPGLIPQYFGTMPQLRRKVMRAAVTRKDMTVLAQGLAAGDPHAKAAGHDDKRNALEALLV